MKKYLDKLYHTLKHFLNDSTFLVNNESVVQLLPRFKSALFNNRYNTYI